MEKHTILGGKVHVYKRDNSRFWQCSTYLAGRKRRASTHQELLPRAEEVAEDWYLELRGKVRTGELSGGRTFDQAAEQFLREYLVITGGERNAKYVEDHQSRLRNHLIPFFGKIHLTRITAGKVQEYRVHRMSSDRANAVAKKTFEQAAEEFELEYRGPRKAREFESHKLRLATHLVPYFAGLKLSELIHERIEEYRFHRQAELDLTTALGKEALHKELATLGLVIRWAKRLSRTPTRSTTVPVHPAATVDCGIVQPAEGGVAASARSRGANSASRFKLLPRPSVALPAGEIASPRAADFCRKNTATILFSGFEFDYDHLGTLKQDNNRMRVS